MGAHGLAGMLEFGTAAQALEWHLSANCFPPIHRDFWPGIREAILIAQGASDADGFGISDSSALWNLTVDFPNGKSFTVSHVIRSLHLEQFLSGSDGS